MEAINLESIEKIEPNRLDGICKPEMLKNDLSGFYSRRINDKDRLIYKYDEDTVQILSAYGHYSDK